MKKILFIVTLIFVILIVGCGTEISPGGIPDAKSDETYTTTITAKGAAPFTCKQVGATDIGGTLTLAKDCVISGTAPHAVETKIISFKVEITDANGNSNTLDMTLTVHPPPVQLELDEKIGAKLGEKFEYNFCKPKPGMNCGEESDTPTGGNPPYTFTISGQPMGLIMSLNGDLKGTIPELANSGEYNVEVCVKDTKGASDCKNTMIEITEKKNEFEGKWIGTVYMSETYTTWSDTIEVSVESEGPIAFIVDPRGYMAEDGGTLMTTTLKQSGACNGEKVVERGITFSGSSNEEGFVESSYLVGDNKYGDLEDTILVATDCETLSSNEIEDIGTPFSRHDVTFQLGEGVVFDETFTKEGSSRVEKIKIELHKVE